MGYINTDTIEYSCTIPSSHADFNEKYMDKKLHDELEWLIGAGFRIDEITIQSTKEYNKIHIKGIK